MSKELKQTYPLFAFDVDLVVYGKPAKYKLLQRWSLIPRPIFDVEYALIQLRKHANVALLSQHEIWQDEILQGVIEHACYNYMIPVRTKDEFEIFRDTYMPYAIHSNIPKALWQGEYSDVHEYERKDWASVFNQVREDIAF